MITQIVQSIAIIPDIIKRQIYTKDCSVSLGIQEDVLTRKVVELRKKYLEEQRKKKSAPEKNTESENTPVADPTPIVEPQPPTANISIKEQNLQKKGKMNKKQKKMLTRILFALALMWVPSMNMMLGSTMRLLSALLRMCSKISSLNSGGNLLQNA